MRCPTAGVLAVLLACGDARPYSDVTLSVKVSGPGHVMVSGGVEARCAQTCELAVPRGADVTLTATARAGGTFDGFGGACSGTNPCAVRVDENAESTAAFRWLPLPRVTRYTWKRIDNGVTTYFRHLDSYGNAYGYQNAGGSASRPFPVRYDAVTERIERLPGIDRAQVLAANDAGEVLMASLDLGLIRYRDGAWSVVAGPDSSVRAYDMSEEGWVVGLAYPGSLSGDYVPWVYDGEAAIAWASDAGRGVAMAVDSSGLVVGDHAVEELLPQGWAWIHYAVIIRRDGIEALPIGEPATVRDLSDTGLVVGALRDVGIGGEGFTYDLNTGTLKRFEPLEDDWELWLDRVNASGTVVIGSGMTNRGQKRPVVLFVNEGRLVDLSSLVDLPPELLLASANSVNVNGQILVTALVTGQPDGDPWANLILTPE